MLRRHLQVIHPKLLTGVVMWPTNVIDYLPSYPHPMDPDFQLRISEKREFAMLHSCSGETIATGDLYSQQKFVRLTTTDCF